MSDSDKTLRPNSNNKNDKTLRPTVNTGDKTLRPTVKGDDKSDKTLRPTASQQSAMIDKTLRPTTASDSSANAQGTLRAARKSTNDSAPKDQLLAGTAFKQFTLGGKNYDVEGLLSGGTGEAEVYRLSLKGRRYALKLYYQGVVPNTDVLDIIKQNSGNGLLAEVVDWGVWVSPTAEKRYYELMPYYTGGSLEQATVPMDEKQLEKTALQAIMSIHYCHSKGVFHKDIKPGNFFYVDDSRDRIVLADFGISSTFKRDNKGNVIPFRNINQNRTKIYAAPEMYTDVLQLASGEVELEFTDLKSDYFSLGMVLLVLCLGEKVFASMSERELTRLKRRENHSSLPYPDNMAPHTVQLIKGLTIPDKSRRWGYEQVEKWARNEPVPMDEEEQDSQIQFHIVYSGTKNQIAHNPEELADFMAQDIDLAIGYLYDGKIAKWFGDCKFFDLQQKAEDIVNHLYPKARRSGFMAMCLTLDPDAPYIDKIGTKCRTDQDIADSLSFNLDYYAKALADPDDALYVFYRAHSIYYDKIFVPKIKKEGTMGVWNMIYTIDPEREFVVSEDETNYVACNTVEDIIKSVKTIDFNNYTKQRLVDDSFLVWLYHRDAALAGKIRAAVKAEGKLNKDFGWLYILYLLDPKLNYMIDYSTDRREGACFTRDDVAYMLNTFLIDGFVLNPEGSEHGEDYGFERATLYQLLFFQDSRLYYYLKSKGVYQQTIDWINYCMDFESKENKDKLKVSTYGWFDAFYKTIEGMGCDSFYYFEECDKYVYNVTDLKSIPDAVVATHLEAEEMQGWLAVQYHEDPEADLSEKFGFESLVVDYMDKLGEYCPDDENYDNYVEAHDEVWTRARKLRRKAGRLLTMRIVLGFLTLLPIGALIAALAVWGLPFDSSPLTHYSKTAVIVMTIIFGLVILFSSDGGFWPAVIGGAILANVVWFVVYFVLKLIFPFASWIIIALLLLVMVWIIMKCYVKLPINRRNKQYLLRPGFEEMELEPLYNTFKDNGATFYSSIEDDSDTYGEYLNGATKKLCFRAIPTILISCGLIFLFLLITPDVGAYVNGNIAHIIPVKESISGTYTGTFGTNSATLTIEPYTNRKKVEGTISVKFSKLNTEKIEGLVGKHGEVLFFDVVENGTLDGNYKGKVSDDGTMLTGTYNNPKTDKTVEFSFTKDVQQAEE